MNASPAPTADVKFGYIDNGFGQLTDTFIDTHIPTLYMHFYTQAVPIITVQFHQCLEIGIQFWMRQVSLVHRVILSDSNTT